ncbi:MAG: hypothetical protein WBA57_14240 [Elainellaceae cyanobacterium]
MSASLPNYDTWKLAYPPEWDRDEEEDDDEDGDPNEPWRDEDLENE